MEVYVGIEGGVRDISINAHRSLVQVKIHIDVEVEAIEGILNILHALMVSLQPLQISV
jgi:hypothetical protein